MGRMAGRKKEWTGMEKGRKMEGRTDEGRKERNRKKRKVRIKKEKYRKRRNYSVTKFTRYAAIYEKQ